MDTTERGTFPILFCKNYFPDKGSGWCKVIRHGHARCVCEDQQSQRDWGQMSKKNRKSDEREKL